MTKEQAIKKIQAIIDCDLRELNTMPQHKALQNEVEALDMAIEALEQQPSDDCVSRQTVLDKKVLIELPDGQSFYCIGPEDVENLPPVTPTRKSGLRWVERFDDTDKWLECPHCHKDSDNAYAYCPNCGASFKEEKRGDEDGSN